MDSIFPIDCGSSVRDETSAKSICEQFLFRDAILLITENRYYRFVPRRGYVKLAGPVACQTDVITFVARFTNSRERNRRRPTSTRRRDGASAMMFTSRPHRNGTLHRDRTADQYQTEIPRTPLIRQFRVQVDLDVSIDLGMGEVARIVHSDRERLGHRIAADQSMNAISMTLLRYFSRLKMRRRWTMDGEGVIG